jgi:hypothetical protein
VDELPANPKIVALAGTVAGDAAAGTVAGDVVAYPVELAELLDADVDELTEPVTLIAPRWLSRFQHAQSIEAQALEDTADGGSRDASFGGDRLAGHALAAQRLNLVDRGLGVG